MIFLFLSLNTLLYLLEVKVNNQEQAIHSFFHSFSQYLSSSHDLPDLKSGQRTVTPGHQQQLWLWLPQSPKAEG